MLSSELSFRIKTATEKDILEHLTECNNTFIPILSERLNLSQYANKIFEKSITFEAWEKDNLIGLIAAYFNDYENRKGFITNVSLIKSYLGRGIASVLLKNCVKYAKQNNFNIILLEVNIYNEPAIRLYKKFGFIEQNKTNELLSLKLIVN